MTVIARRKGEPLDEAARRVATDALYAARDNGGTMHDAGAAAGDAVSSLYAGAVEALRRICEEPCPHQTPDGPRVPMCPDCAEDALGGPPPARGAVIRRYS